MPGTITGKHILYDVSLTINAVDLSDHCESLSIEVATNKHPAAAMGELQDYDLAGTLQISDPQITFFQDYAAAKVYATIHAAWAARTTFNIVAKASSGAASATNPAWTIPCFVAKSPVMSGKRGDRHMAPVTLAVAGAYSIAVA